MLAGPDVHFVDSKYFVHIDPPKDAPIATLCVKLKPGASAADKRELEEYVNHELDFRLAPYLKKLGLKHPYWTWEGKLVEKSSLPKDYPYSKGWRGIWKDYYKMLDSLPKDVIF